MDGKTMDYLFWVLVDLIENFEVVLRELSF